MTCRNPACFSFPKQVGENGPTVTPAFYGPAFFNADLGLFKNFRVTEKVKTQFRAECLNAWNHPNLSTPNTTPTNSSFGAITSQDVPRSWQMSLNVTF